MRHTIRTAVLALVCGAACAEEDTNLFYRAYFALSGMQLEDDAIQQREPGTLEARWKRHLSESVGVTWPAGSDLFFSLDGSYHLIARNTRKNLSRIDEHVAWEYAQRQVEIEVSSVAFDPNEIDRLQAGSGVTLESLNALRRQGRSQLITTARVITKSGQEAVAKSVQELVCPVNGSGETDTNRAESVAGSMTPGVVEKREVGTILQVTPRLSKDSQTIELTLNPQWVALVRRETQEGATGAKDGGKKMPLQQPVIETASVQAQIAVEDGETLLLGGGKKSGDNQVLYLFMSARMVRSRKTELYIRR